MTLNDGLHETPNRLTWIGYTRLVQPEILELATAEANGRVAAGQKLLPLQCQTLTRRNGGLFWIGKAVNMGPIHANKTALVLGALMGGWYLMWAILVALGWGQKVIDFVLWMHFIKPVYIIDSFNIGTAAILIAVTSAIGYAMGGAFAIVWNYVQRPYPRSSGPDS